MRRKWYLYFIMLFFAGTPVTCIDPYSTNLDKFESVLVVDALLTNEDISNYVSLSRTIEKAHDEPAKVSGALVTIKDDLGNSTTLSETSEGLYKTDSLIFRGEAGRSYTLHIKTNEGEEYESESCLMSPLQDIDSIYFGRDHEILDNETREGIRIYIDSKGESDCNYYRWTFEEWWKFSVPNPKLYDYVNESTFIECTQIKQICWGNKKSNEIIIKSTDAGISNRFVEMPVLFVASEKSDRLTIQYYIRVKQLSISKEEYQFWDRMRQINDSGGDIFDKQPFQITGNIHNISKPEEQVLGYFQVSAAKVKHKYLTAREATEMGVPSYRYECEKITIGPDDFPVDPMGQLPPPTFDHIYELYHFAYIFVEPVIEDGKLVKLIFATPACADCTLGGSLTKPDFWIDLD